jgi:hypothetical protein
MADTKAPGFFSLPYEIREMIYELVLVSDQWITAERLIAVPTAASWPYPTYPPDPLSCYGRSRIANGKQENGWSGQFLRVCKSFHAEASHFLYGCNKFQLSFETLEQLFLPTIGTRNASLIRYMDTMRTELCRFKAIYTIPTVLQALPNLRCLYLMPIIQTSCSGQCTYFCKHTGSHRKILVLRLAHLVTSGHPHLKWLLEFKDVAYGTRNNVWYKLSDDEGNKHPPRPHDHSDRHHHWQRHLNYEVAGDVVDIEEQLTRIKVIRVPTGRYVSRVSPPAKRPPWRV